jgi:hypothetical protein
LGVTSYVLKNASRQLQVLTYIANSETVTRHLSAGEVAIFSADSLTAQTEALIRHGYLIASSAPRVIPPVILPSVTPVVMGFNWSAEPSYPAGVIVRYSDEFWMSLQRNTNVTPGTDDDIWVALVVDVESLSSGTIEQFWRGDKQWRPFSDLYVNAALSGVPTAPTAAQGTSTTQIATTAFTRAEIAALVNSSPLALDTLNELAAALGNDANFAATIATALAGKQPIDSDLTAIAALTTDAFGRALLTKTDAAAVRVHISAQQLDDDLTSIAALTTTSYGRNFLTKADAAAARAHVGLDNVTNDAQVKRSEMGAFSGVATLDVDGKLLQTNFPSGLDLIDLEVRSTDSGGTTANFATSRLYSVSKGDSVFIWQDDLLVKYPFHFYDSGTGNSNILDTQSSVAMTADRTLGLDSQNADHILKLGVDDTEVQFPSGNYTLAKYEDTSFAYRDINAEAAEQIDSRIAGHTADATSQDLFSTRNNGSSTYVRSATFFAKDLDLTGVSVYTDETTSNGALKTVTLIGPDVGIAAHHTDVTVGRHYRFVAADGTVTTLTVHSVAQIVASANGGDVDVVRFTSPAPASIKYYPILSLPALNRFVESGTPVFYIDQNQQGFVAETNGGAFSLQQGTGDRAPFWKSVISGDSGHPVFAVLGDELALIGTFFGITFGPAVSNYIADINTAIGSLGSSAELTFLDFAVVGTAANLDAADVPTVGQIPKIKSDGKLDISIIPDLTLGFGNQTPNEGFFGPATGFSDDLPSFRSMVDLDLPLQFALRVNVTTFSSNITTSNIVGSGTTVYSQTGTMSGPLTVTLSHSLTTPPSFGIGRVIIVKDSSGTCSPTNTITVTGTTNGWTFDGASSFVIDSPYGSVTLWSDTGTLKAWRMIARDSRDTDGTLAANSDNRVATQKAVKTYADTGLALKIGTSDVGKVTDTILANAVKPAVAVVAVANLTLSGEQTIDGVLTSGSLVLATAQTTGSQNGPWVTGAGAWTRPGWYTSGSTTQAPQFLTTFVRLGTLYQGSTWRMTTASVTIDTTATTWVQTPITTSSLPVDTDTSLAANSDTKIATQKATKAYADTKQTALGFTAENVANKDTDGTLAANSDTKYPSQKAVKTYADTKQTALGFTAENVANKDTDTALAANSDTKYPSQKAIKAYADTKVPSTRTVNGRALSSDITITPADVGTLTFVARTADATGRNSGNTGTTLTDDDTLIIPVAANHTYAFTVCLQVNAANNTMDVKFGFSVPSGTTMSWGIFGASTQATWISVAVVSSPSLLLAAGGTQQVGTSAGTSGIVLQGIITTSATAGNVALQWAQVTSDAGDLKLLAGSYLSYVRLY